MCYIFFFIYIVYIIALVNYLLYILEKSPAIDIFIKNYVILLTRRSLESSRRERWRDEPLILQIGIVNLF